MTSHSTWGPIGLVASREVKEKGSDRKFLIATAALVMLVVGLVVAPALMQRDPSYTVGVAPQLHDDVDEALTHLEVRLAMSVSVQELPQEEARRQVIDGGIDAYVATRTQVLVPSHPDDALVNMVQQGIGALAVRESLVRHNVDAAVAEKLLTGESPQMEIVGGRGDDAAAREAAARIAVFILFGQIATYAFWVASGVVEEKSTRVVELIVSAIRPWQLLIGKIAGLGLLGLAQLLVIGTAGLVAAVAVGSIHWDLNLVAALAVSLMAYALGFVFYASLYAAAASTISRQEELGSVTGVIQGMLMGSLVLSFLALEPGSATTRVASWLPMTSPLLAPPQLLAGEASLASVLGATVVLMACVAAVIPVAARLYGHAVLHTGARLSLRAAWHNRTDSVSAMRGQP